MFDAFRDLILSVDPRATKNKGDRKENYTVWQPYELTGPRSNNRRRVRVWKVQVDRFTKIDNDPIAMALLDALDAAHIPYTYLLDYEKETGYHHHIYDCEVI